MKTWNRFIAGLLLGVYILTGTAVVPALVTLTAALDGGHDLRVELSETGTRLTLIHQAGHFTPAITDHSNPASRAVVGLCRNDQAGNHEFKSSSLSSRGLWDPGFKAREGLKVAAWLNHDASWLHQNALAFCFAMRANLVPSYWHAFAMPHRTPPLPMMATVQLLI